MLGACQWFGHERSRAGDKAHRCHLGQWEVQALLGQRRIFDTNRQVDAFFCKKVGLGIYKVYIYPIMACLS